jgi:hypothetical protein
MSIHVSSIRRKDGGEKKKEVFIEILTLMVVGYFLVLHQMMLD